MNEDIKDELDQHREEIKKNPLVIFEERPDWVRPDDCGRKSNAEHETIVQIFFSSSELTGG